MRRGGALTATVASGLGALLLAASAGAATPQQIYRDLADNNRLDRQYSRADIERALGQPVASGVRAARARTAHAADASRPRRRPDCLREGQPFAALHRPRRCALRRRRRPAVASRCRHAALRQRPRNAGARLAHGGPSPRDDPERRLAGPRQAGQPSSPGAGCRSSPQHDLGPRARDPRHGHARHGRLCGDHGRCIGGRLGASRKMDPALQPHRGRNLRRPRHVRLTSSLRDARGRARRPHCHLAGRDGRALGPGDRRQPTRPRGADDPHVGVRGGLSRGRQDRSPLVAGEGTPAG